MKVLQPGEAQVYSHVKQNMQRSASVTNGDVKYMTINVLKGLQFAEAGAGGVQNLQAPSNPPPEVRTGLVMNDIG